MGFATTLDQLQLAPYAYVLMDKTPKPDVLNRLTAAEENILLHKGTEAPFSGEYNQHFANGIYICKQCNMPLYTSFAKFRSQCGWPSFDDEIESAVKHLADPDGHRTEIVCANCEGHLGHVFFGEQATAKNTRHCVNSLSIRFIPISELLAQAKQQQSRFGAALFAAGCFWGVEYHFARERGVLATQVGYSGGTTDDPSYEEVCTGNTGHAEALLVIFDKSKTDYAKLTKLFFNLHDPSQVDRQGPDIGNQYRSVIFYYSDEQHRIAEELIATLKQNNINVVTQIIPAPPFWPAEDYHQQYYQIKGGEPYCHSLTERFRQK